MKKIVAFIIVVIFISINLTTFNTFAASERLDKLFSDNFNGNLSKWANPKIDPSLGAPDASCGEWRISNGVLEQTDIGTSFAYISPKHMKWKNFIITAKVKFSKDSGDDTWFGFSVRKDANFADARYNGCNNVMVYVRKNGKVETLRGYIGGNYLDIGVDGKQTGAIKNTVAFREYKLTVIGTKYSLSVDGKTVYEISYPKLTEAGYISINSCINHIYVGSFKVKPIKSSREDSNSPTKASEVNQADSTQTPSPTQNNTISKGPQPVKASNNQTIVFICLFVALLLLLLVVIIIILIQKNKKKRIKKG